MFGAMKSLLKSRKVWVAVAGVIVGIVAKHGINLSDTAVLAILLPVVSVIFGIAIEDAAKAPFEGEAK